MLVNTYLDFCIELISARGPKTLKPHCGYGPSQAKKYAQYLTEQNGAANTT
jgi:hypothetical protein